MPEGRAGNIAYALRCCRDSLARGEAPYACICGRIGGKTTRRLATQLLFPAMAPEAKPPLGLSSPVLLRLGRIVVR